MALELLGSVFSVLRKLYRVATEAKANLDRVRIELDTNDGAFLDIFMLYVPGHSWHNNH